MEIIQKITVPALVFVLLTSLGAVAGEAKTATCSSQNAEKFVQMISIKFWRMIKNEPVTLYMMDLDKCFVVGQKIEIFETKVENGQVYWKFSRGTAKVQSIEKINFATYNKRELGKAVGQELEIFKKKLIKYTGKNGAELEAAPLLALTIVRDKFEDRLTAYGSPRRHPAAKSFNKREFVEELNQGHVYDVRPLSLKKEFPLNKAKNLVFTNYAWVTQKILSPLQIKKTKANFTGLVLPQKKEDPVYIISGCTGEFSAYNALTLLASKGYKNLGWFPGGMAEFGKKPHPCITPDKLSEATIVQAAKVRELIKEKNIFIADVREQARFTLVGATSFPFLEKRNALSIPTYRDKVTAAGLVSNKEIYSNEFMLSIPKESTILIVGDNEYDWRAYKAAIFLKAKGVKNIYWYRDGMEDWAQKVLFYPAEYTLNRKTKNGELY